MAGRWTQECADAAETGVTLENGYVKLREYEDSHILLFQAPFAANDAQ